jgi:hypothetical protein
MEMTHVFAGLAVSDYQSARGWYERLLGRPADMLQKKTKPSGNSPAQGSSTSSLIDLAQAAD